MTRRSFLRHLGLACAALGVPVAAASAAERAALRRRVVSQIAEYNGRVKLFKDEAQRLASQIGIRETARRIGVSKSVILTWASRDGWLTES